MICAYVFSESIIGMFYLDMHLLCLLCDILWSCSAVIIYKVVIHCEICDIGRWVYNHTMYMSHDLYMLQVWPQQNLYRTCFICNNKLIFSCDLLFCWDIILYIYNMGSFGSTQDLLYSFTNIIYGSVLHLFCLSVNMGMFRNEKSEFTFVIWYIHTLGHTLGSSFN